MKLERSQDVVLLQAIHLILLRSALVSLITISYFEGSGKGADPNRQPCRKAKELRKERKLLKAAQDQVIPPSVPFIRAVASCTPADVANSVPPLEARRTATGRQRIMCAEPIIGKHTCSLASFSHMCLFHGQQCHS